MNYKGLEESVAAQLRPFDVRRYALAAGWLRVGADKFADIAIYRRKENESDEIVVPEDKDFGDYARRMIDVVLAISETEKRDPRSVLDDLFVPSCDVLRFGLSSPYITGGAVSLNEAIALYVGAKTSLLASACTTIQPKTFHPRMALTQATDFIDSCLVGQTEVGSFVAKFLCPVDPYSQDNSVPIPGEEKITFPRRVTQTLMASLDFIAESIRSDRPEKILFTENTSTPPISANLCDALIEMQSLADGTQLTVSASWSKSLGVPQSVPSKVKIPQEYISTIEELSKQLKANPTPVPDTFVAMVDELKGNPGPDGRLQGEAVLSLFIEGEGAISAKAMLTPEQYAVAWKAHNPSHYVYVMARGLLIRGRRVSTLANISLFVLMPNPSDPNNEIR